jgi:hypothetical protein
VALLIGPAEDPKKWEKVQMIGQLEAWYLRQCDGDWEHSFGISIETMDNPGWSVTIDLDETSAEGLALEERSPDDRGSEQDDSARFGWYEIWIEEGRRFRAHCAPDRLEFVITRFLHLVSSVEPLGELQE